MVVDWFIKKCCTPLEQFHEHLRHHHHLSLSCHSDHLLHHHHHHHHLLVVYRVLLFLLVLVATCRHHPQGHPKEYMYYQWKVLSESLQIKSDDQEISNIGWQERDVLYFCTALVSLFSLYNKEYDICGTLVLVHGLKNKKYYCWSVLVLLYGVCSLL